MTKAERQKLLNRLAYMQHGPGRPAQHASDAQRDKWLREVEKLRKSLRYEP